MEQLLIEGVAQAALARGKQEADEAPELGDLITADLGPDAVHYSRAVPGDAALVRIYDAWRIYIRPQLPHARFMFALAHEYAEWILRVLEHYSGPDLERCADALGAAILVPRLALRIARREFGCDFSELANVFQTTETCIALREAEVEELPRVVVTPKVLYARGPESWVWYDEPTLRRVARSNDEFPGLVRTRLRDEPRRVVLDAVA